MQAILTVPPEQVALASWIRDAKDGDREAFERILISHQREVLRVALRMLGKMEDAQDAAQEVFLRLHQSLAQFEDAREFRPWLYRITVNICLDLLRARRPAAPADFEPSAPPIAERALLIEERKRAVHRALRELPEKERAAIVLREIEGLSTAEVAAILESSEATVRSQVYQARIRLRRLVERFAGRRS